MDIPELDTNAGKDTAPQQSSLNVGMALREAREHLGMSVNDIADRIKFAPKQVEALEANDFAHLPRATFLRGFVRSYARVVQLDEAVLIAALPVESAPQAVARPPVMNVAFPAMQSLRRFNVMWLAGALGVALVLAVFVLLNGSGPATTPTEVVVESLPLPGPDIAASAVAAVPGAEPGETSKTPVMAVEPAKVSPAAAVPVPQSVAASAPEAAAAAKPPVPLELLKRRPLHFVFSEKTWAEVIDVNGNILLSKTNPGGSEQWIGGPKRAPYDISIAHPANVKLYYKGKEIDLSPYAGMETARLKVE
jgi:cytoskeleton protein RodZ